MWGRGGRRLVSAVRSQQLRVGVPSTHEAGAAPRPRCTPNAGQPGPLCPLLAACLPRCFPSLFSCGLGAGCPSANGGPVSGEKPPQAAAASGHLPRRECVHGPRAQGGGGWGRRFTGGLWGSFGPPCLFPREGGEGRGLMCGSLQGPQGTGRVGPDSNPSIKCQPWALAILVRPPRPHRRPKRAARALVTSAGQWRKDPLSPGGRPSLRVRSPCLR